MPDKLKPPQVEELTASQAVKPIQKERAAEMIQLAQAPPS